ncbi:MAG: ROK family protein [Vicinamibacterales bacterium]|nr:ROK family protein [Vicinamibacterales bacterium]
MPDRRTSTSSRRASAAPPRAPRTLTIDIGGSGLKAALLDARGHVIGDPVRIPTPADRPPDAIVRVLVGLVSPLGVCDRVSVGFPGLVRDGVVQTAPNFDSPAWQGFALADALAQALDRPVRVLNDADLQGLGAISGRGLELVVTLGTGVGTALFLDGRLLPHLELSRHPVHRGKNYDQYLGKAARKRVGKRRWRARVHRVLAILESVINYDTLHIGGGGAKHLGDVAAPRIRLTDNRAALIGGLAVWR